ncbi:MAG: phosphoglycerate kinase [Deltaproteobacteria bacterium]|nr:phosphoglycerate kinase [Deltaproteobacteria bacterium]
MIRGLDQLDLTGKTVFVRADFNVPVRDGKITETHRIDSTLPTLRFVLARAGKVLLASHLGRPGGKPDARWSLTPVREHLEKSLARPVALAPDCVGPQVEALVRDPGQKVILLENLRFHKEEEANDPAFSQALASLADVYVNDAFGAAHRAHASTAGMARFFRAKGAGLLLRRELDYLGKALFSPDRPFVVILGGAKVSDKIGMLKNLVPKVDSLLIGGGMAYTFLKARGVAVGKSLIEEEKISLAREIIRLAESRRVPLLLPVDHIAAEQITASPITTGADIPANYMGLDIGPKTVSRFCQEIGRARMVIWNGPVGLFEEEKFSRGTRSVAQALVEHGAISIVAGGDTVAAVAQAGVEDKITHLSTGGGATLEFLEGKILPGIQALEEEP